MSHENIREVETHEGCRAGNRAWHCSTMAIRMIGPCRGIRAAIPGATIGSSSPIPPIPASPNGPRRRRILVAAHPSPIPASCLAAVAWHPLTFPMRSADTRLPGLAKATTHAPISGLGLVGGGKILEKVVRAKQALESQH
jgi:hypothetical protein